MKIRYGFIAEYGGARYRIILLDPVEELLFPQFEGAEVGRWYRIEMNGAQSPKITGRIADIFETRLAASGSAKNGPYQILIPVMNADLPKQFSINCEDKREFYSPVLQTNGRLLRFQDEGQFQHGKLYSAYVTIISFNTAPIENIELENSLTWTLEGCDIICDWDLSTHTSCLLELFPGIHTEIETIWYELYGVSEMEKLDFPDVSTSQLYTLNKVDKTEETSPVCGQTVFRKVPLPTKKSIPTCSDACSTEKVRADEALGKPSRSSNNNADTDTVLVDNDVSDTDSTVSTLSSSTDSSEKPQQIMEIAQHQQALPTPMSTCEGITVTVPTADADRKSSRGRFGTPRRMAIDEDQFVDPPKEVPQQQQIIEPSNNVALKPKPIKSPNNDTIDGKNNGTIFSNNMGTSAGASFPPPNSNDKKLGKEKSASALFASDGMTDDSKVMNSFDETVANSSSGKFKTKENYGSKVYTTAICWKVDWRQNMFWLMLFDVKKDVIINFNGSRSASMWSEAVSLRLPRIESWYKVEYSYNRERKNKNDNQIWVHKIQKVQPRIPTRNFNGLIQFRLFARRETSQNGIDEYKTKFGPIEFDTNWPLPFYIATNKPAEFSAWCVFWWEAKPKKQNGITVLFRGLTSVQLAREIATDESVNADNTAHHFCEQPLVGSSAKSEQGEGSTLERLRGGITSNAIESEAVTNAINDTGLNMTMTAASINTDYAGPIEPSLLIWIYWSLGWIYWLFGFIGSGSNKTSTSTIDDRIEVVGDCTESLQEMSSMTVKEPISISKVPTPQSRRQDGSKSNASTSDKQSNVHEYRLKVENASSEHLNSDLPNHAESNGLVVQSTEITLNNNDRTILPEVQSPKSLSLSSNIPEPQQKTAQSVEAFETETEHSTTETASNDGSSKNAADRQNQNSACSGVKGKCEPNEYKAFAFCWYKNNVDIFLVLYNKKTIIGYRQVTMNCLPTGLNSNIKLGVWYKIRYSKYSNSMHIRIYKLADARQARLAQLPSLRMSSDGGNHVEICIENWSRIGPCEYRNALGELLIADTKVNEILATAIDKWNECFIWCKIKKITKGRQLEFVDYKLRGGNLDHYATVNGNKLQLDHANCSSALAEPKPPAVVLSNNNLAKTKSSDVDGNGVSKSLTTNGVQHQPQMSSKLSIGTHNGSISAIIEKDVMVLWRQSEMDAFFVVFNTQKKCFTKFSIASMSTGAMKDSFAGLRIGGWYNVNYRNYAKTGEHIWVNQILETDEHLSTRVRDSVEFCVQCYRVDGGSYSSSSLGEFSSSTSGAVGNGQLSINGTRNACFGNETEEKKFAWFRLVSMGKFAFVEPDKGNGFSPTTNVK